MLHLRIIVLTALAGAALLMSATAYGAEVVSGKVVNDNGNPVAGVPVYLYDETLSGTTQTLNAVASTTSASDGTYSLDLDVTPGYMSKASANGGSVNFDVVAANGTLLAYSGVARYPVPAGTCPPFIPTCRPTTVDSWSEDPVADPDASAAAAAAGPPPMPVPVLLQAEVAPGSGSVAASSLASAPCTVVKTFLASQVNWGTAGQLHIPKDASANFKYGASADSDIGIGFSKDNANWSIKGSTHVGNTRSAEITLNKATSATARYAKKTKTQFKTSKYRYDANCTGQHWFNIKGEKWTGSAGWGDDMSQYNGHCLDTYFQWRAQFPEDSVFLRNDKNFANYKGALDVFGFGLSVQSGASRWVTERWKFGTKLGTYWLCGNDGFVTESHRIYAGA